MKLIFNAESVILDEAFLEVKYDSVFKLHKLHFDVLDAIKPWIKEYNINQNVILCKNDENALHISVAIDRLYISQARKPQDKLDYFNFSKTVSQITNAVCKVLDIRTGKRVGVRTYWRKDTENLEEASNLLKENYFNFSSSQSSKLKLPMDLVTFSIISKSMPWKYNLTIKPEETVWFEAGFDDAQEKIVTDRGSYIKIDWDFYAVDDFNLSEIPGFLKEANKRFVNEILPFLSRGMKDE